jgi:hypothetical protein
MNFFYFGDIPASVQPLDQSDILSGVRVKRSRKRYDRTAVEYATLTRKENEQVYFESFGYDSDNAPSPVIIQPGVYYPFESAPEIESAEGQVYQSFVSGYAESRKKYNGELEYRRSKDTSLLHTSNHRVVQDWEGSIAINRKEFESLRASVRLRNTGNTDARLRQFAIRADAIYRNKPATVTAGPISGERTFNTDAEFIYRAIHAETLATTLYRFFSRSGFNIDLTTDALLIPPGSYRKIDTGKSGLAVDALLFSYTLDCDKEIYSYKAVSIGPATVDVSRFKNAESDTFKGDPGEAGKYVDYRFAFSAAVGAAPSYTANADNPGNNWEDTPPSITTTQYLWMIQADWRNTTRLTPWSAPVRISGPAGADGAPGNYYQNIYRRANERPATPAGNDPSGWTNDPSSFSGLEPLWMSRGIKNAAGVLQGAWSVPVKISGEDGLGIGSLPRDACAYWSCDELPDIPDSPSGCQYRNDAAWSGWGIDPPEHEGTVTRVNGVIIVTGRKHLYRDILFDRGGHYIIIRARQTKGTLAELRVNMYDDNNYFPHVLGALTRVWKIFCIVIPQGMNRVRDIYRSNYLTDEATLEISDLYIGNLQYLSPLIDNSGNRRHMQTHNMISVQGKFGKGLLCVNGGNASASGILNNHSGDFAVSVWTNKPTNILGKRAAGPGLGFSIQNGRANFVSNNSNTELYAGTAFTENGLFHHLVLMVKNKVLSLHVDGQLSGQTNITNYYTGPLDSYDFFIGKSGGCSNNAADGTIIDEIAVFDYALTDKEIKALYYTSLEKNYTETDWRLDTADLPPKYLGAVSVKPSSYTSTVTVTNGAGTVTAHKGDWVAYVGATSGNWVKGCCMRWNGQSWEAVPINNSGAFESSLYMAALIDLTEGAPEETFMSILVRDLIAARASIDTIFSKYNTLLNGGYIQSESTTNGLRDFIIRSNGEAVFRKATIYGDVYANNGVFKGRVEADSGSFEGSLSGQLKDSGHLYIHDSHHIVYGNTTLSTIYTALHNIGINYKAGYERVLCSGYIKLGNYPSTGIITILMPKYIKINSNNTIYLWVETYRDGSLISPGSSFGISSGSNETEYESEFLVF